MIDVSRYHAIIMDIDGTMYFQNPVQLYMAFSILFFCIPHPFRWKETFTVRDYRKLYERNINYFKRCIQLENKYHLSVSEIERIIQYWMVERPLPFVYTFRDKRFLLLLEHYRKYGVKVIVYSDYPIVEKFQMLNFKPDDAYSADDVGYLKPAPNGLLHILEEHNLVASDCLFVGDRQDKDEKCADNVGMDCFIISKGYIRRKGFYDMLEM